MNKPETDPVAIHFQSWLKARYRADGNRVPDVAKGDCTIMLQLIRMKLDDFGGQIDISNPGRFRGVSVLLRDMERVLGQVPKLHYTKWGASHHRGAFRDDSGRGNKRHLIRLASLLNEYSDTLSRLQEVYDFCIERHHNFWDEFSFKVLSQKEDPFQKRLMSLLSLQSLGRVQQGLVYSALKHRYGKEGTITTKRTFAGDEQSSQSGVSQRGDIQVRVEGVIVMALEIKDVIIDKATWDRVLATHGEHDYALFVLGTGFRPKGLQQSIGSLAATYAVHLADFMITLVFTTAADKSLQPSVVLSEILAIYNSDFCEVIEEDPSLRITMEEV